MKKNLSFFHYSIFSLLAALLLTSCGSHVAYLQNSDLVDLSNSEYLYDARIMPKDLLTITVSTVNREASEPYNLMVRPTLNVTSNSVATSGGSLQPYLVDNEGNIDFPVLGTLRVSGLTKRECEQMIHDKLLRFMNEVENPIVTVRMSNYKISVLGEVSHPGMFTVDNEKINIFEALAKAGDLTIYGQRDKVKLIRENAQGRKEIHKLNLNDTEIINSPYYYLQQNDIIYVEPNKVKAGNSGIGSSTTIWISVTGSLISLASLIVTILR